MTPRALRPLVLTIAFSSIVVAVLIVGALLVRTVVAGSFQDANTIRVARALVADLMREQLDEETGMRGYLAARAPILLQPYYDGRVQLPDSLKRVGSVVEGLHLTQASAALSDAAETNRRWLNEVAYPLLAARAGSAALELHGKQLVDRFRTDMATIETQLARRDVAVAAHAQRAIIWVGTFAVVAIAVVVVAALLFAVQQFRFGTWIEKERTTAEEQRRHAAEIRAAYEAEKRIADTLQEAFVQNVLPRLPTIGFSATYLPAAEEAKVGGDWYDALELSQDRVLVAIGDVAGHGIEAAVAMNKTRQLLVSCALMDPNPGPILERVNAELLRNNSAMITAVAGLVDARNYRFSYAVAGHPPPVLLEPGRAARILETGSLPLGVMRGAPYATHCIQSVPGALLVLYTDGAIEHSRDVLEGEALLLEVVEMAATRPHAEAAAVISEGIFGARKIADDVAILTIRFSDSYVPDLGAARRVA